MPKVGSRSVHLRLQMTNYCILWFGMRLSTGRLQQSFSENTTLTYSRSYSFIQALTFQISSLLPIVHWPSFIQRVHNNPRTESTTWTSFILSLREPSYCLTYGELMRACWFTQWPIVSYSCLVRARHLRRRVSLESCILVATCTVVSCTVHS